MASLVFKSQNLIKMLESGSKVPFASLSRVGLPTPRFRARWSGIRERVRNFGESGSQRVDIPPIFQGDLILKLFVEAKPSTIKRKEKNVKVPAIKKPSVYTFLPYLVSFVIFFMINSVCDLPFFFISLDL